jgi:DNA primase
VPLIAQSSIDEVQIRLDAISVVGDYLRLEKKSGRWWGCCPFHQENTPSFTVNPDLKTFYCFGCHRGGTIISFVMEMDKLTFPEAIEQLARKSGVELIYESGGGDLGAEAAERKRAEEKREALYELYRRVSGTFHYFLLQTPQGRPALDSIMARGISTETIESFHLGYVPADRRWLYDFLLQKGYSAALLAESGLFSAKYPQAAFFSNRLMFPINDREGRTVAFGARLLEGEGPKYLNSNESTIYHKGKTLFAIDKALPEIRNTKAVYIAEGYLDVIALHQAGVSNAVAPLGTAFTDDQARLLKRWAERTKLIFDADNAGQTAAEKAILTSRKAGMEAAVVVPGLGIPVPGLPAEALAAIKDPADILKQYGGGVLKTSLEFSILDFEYLLHRARKLFDCNAPEGKARAAAYLFPYVQTLASEVARTGRLTDIADNLGVERDAVLADYGRFQRGEERLEKRLVGQKAAESAPGLVTMNDELYVLAAVFLNRGLYPKLRTQVAIEEFEDSRARELFIALEEWYRNQGADNLEGPLPLELLEGVQNKALQDFVLEQGASGVFEGDIGKLLDKSLMRIKRKGLERRQKEITLKIRAAKGRDLEELLEEKRNLDDELRIQRN